MDLSIFTLNPVTLAVLILGIVEFLKRLGLAGNKLMLVSMAVGVLFATVYKLHELYPPAEPYLEVAFFGIAAGLCASGIYSFITNRFPDQSKKATMKYTKIVQTRKVDDDREIS
jgi:hypothetical protein